VSLTFREPAVQPDTVSRSIRTNKRLYSLTRAFLFGSFRIWFRISVHNASAVPDLGGVLIAPTHRSFLDIPAIAVGLQRPSRFMGKRALFRRKAFAAFFAAYGTFPVRAGAVDRQAINTCIELLNAGDVVTVFPEGGLGRSATVGDVFSGLAFIAFRAQCPIVPVGIAGTEKAMGRGMHWPRPRKIVVEFGAPIDVARYGEMKRQQGIDALTSDLRERMQQTFDAANERRA